MNDKQRPQSAQNQLNDAPAQYLGLDGPTYNDAHIHPRDLCPGCKGTGTALGADDDKETGPCSECQGSGILPAEDVGELAFMNGRGVVSAEEAAEAAEPDLRRATHAAQDAAVDLLVQSVMHHPQGRFLSLLRALRGSIRELRADMDDHIDDIAQQHQAHHTQQLDILYGELRKVLLISNITLAGMVEADRHLEAVMASSWVFDQLHSEDDRPARECALYALHAAFDALTALAEEV